MSKKVTSYDNAFKAKVALEAYKGEKTILEICSSYKIPKTNVHEWLNKLKEKAANLFGSPEARIRELNTYKQEIENLHNVIGEITVENKYLKKKLGR